MRSGPISTIMSHEEKPWNVSNVSSLERLGVVLLGQPGIILLSSKETPEISLFSRAFCLNLGESYS